MGYRTDGQINQRGRRLWPIGPQPVKQPQGSAGTVPGAGQTAGGGGGGGAGAASFVCSAAADSLSYTVSCAGVGAYTYGESS